MKESKKPRSITQFLQAKRRENCGACKLSVEVRRQIDEARHHSRATWPLILEWLEVELGITGLTEAEMVIHYRARHDPDAGHRRDP